MRISRRGFSSKDKFSVRSQSNIKDGLAERENDSDNI